MVPSATLMKRSNEAITTPFYLESRFRLNPGEQPAIYTAFELCLHESQSERSRSDGGIDQDPPPSWIAAGSPVLFFFWCRTEALSPNARFSDFQKHKYLLSWSLRIR